MAICSRWHLPLFIRGTNGYDICYNQWSHPSNRHDHQRRHGPRPFCLVCGHRSSAGLTGKYEVATSPSGHMIAHPDVQLSHQLLRIFKLTKESDDLCLTRCTFANGRPHLTSSIDRLLRSNASMATSNAVSTSQRPRIQCRPRPARYQSTISTSCTNGRRSGCTHTLSTSQSRAGSHIH